MISFSFLSSLTIYTTLEYTHVYSSEIIYCLNLNDYSFNSKKTEFLSGTIDGNEFRVVGNLASL